MSATGYTFLLARFQDYLVKLDFSVLLPLFDMLSWNGLAHLGKSGYAPEFSPSLSVLIECLLAPGFDGILEYP